MGQVVVPSLDQSLPTELASAVAWRVGSTIGGEFEVYQQKEDATNDAETKNTRSAVLLAYQPGNLITELYYAPVVKRVLGIDEDTSQVTWDEENSTELSLRVAIRGNRQVSLGLGYQRAEYEKENETQLTSLYEGSFSLRLLDGLLYAGGGMQRVTIDRGSDDSLKYNKVIGGVAFQIGDPIERMFQAEVAMKQTPETDSDKGLITKVPKTTESQLSVEFLTGSFFLAYKYTQVLKEKVLSDKDVTETESRYGIGVRLGSLSFGLYRKAWKSEFDEEQTEYDRYSITVGFNFL